MSDLGAPSLLDRAGLDPDEVRRTIGDALNGAEDGELFLEHRQSESLVFDDGRLRQANTDTTQGFGLRAVAGETSAFAHSSDISKPALDRAADAVRAAAAGHGGSFADAPRPTNRHLYGEENPLAAPEFGEKVRLIQEVDSYLRDKDARVRQVTVSLAGSWQVIEILRPDGVRLTDVRPLVRFNVSVIAGDGSRQETGSYGLGGRAGYESFLGGDAWKRAADEALRQALVNLEAVPAPAGECDVVLGPGWPGILLHEAVGHGLEGISTARAPRPSPGFSGSASPPPASPSWTTVASTAGAVPSPSTTRARQRGAPPSSRTAFSSATCRTGRTPG
jgi:TldD protein